MLLRKRYRTKLIWLVIIAVLFLYWRGLSTIADQNSWELPGIWEILKTGARF